MLAIQSPSFLQFDFRMDNAEYSLKWIKVSSVWISTFSWSTIGENRFFRVTILLLNVNKSSKILSQIHIICLTQGGNYIFDLYRQSWIRNFWLWSVVQHQISGGKFKLIGRLTESVFCQGSNQTCIGQVLNLPGSLGLSMRCRTLEFSSSMQTKYFYPL